MPDVYVANLAQLAGVHRNTLRNPSSERLQGRMRGAQGAPVRQVHTYST